MKNNRKSKTDRSDRKSKKEIMVSDKSQTECKQDWTNYLPIIHKLQIELFIVKKIKKCEVQVGLFSKHLPD